MADSVGMSPEFPTSSVLSTNASPVSLTRYTQDGVTYICAGDSGTDEDVAKVAAMGDLRDGEQLADDMSRVDGCCTWTVEVRS